MEDVHIHITDNTFLSSYITCLIEVRGMPGRTELILPQGSIELVVNLADPISGKLPGCNVFIDTPRYFIQGVHTRTIVARYFGIQHLFIIKFRPEMVQRFLGVAPSELANQVMDITLISPVFQGLLEQVVEAPSFQARVKLLEKHFPVLPETDCPRSAAISELFLSGTVDAFQTVETLAGEVFYSTRQLSRKAHEFFGFSAEELILYKKYMHAVDLIHLDAYKLYDIALQCGFYDQAHFNRTFKHLCGITPGEYKSKKTNLPFHLFT